MGTSTYSPAKVKAFFKEFPFLANFVNWEDVDSPQVSRVTPELLQETASRNATPAIFYAFSIGYPPAILMRRNTRIRLLDKEGNLLYEVGAWKNPHYRWWNPFTAYRFQDETVGDALHRLGEKSRDVYYILSLDWYFGIQLVLYKPPKEFSIPGWLDEQLGVEKANLRKEIAAINARQK